MNAECTNTHKWLVIQGEVYSSHTKMYFKCDKCGEIFEPKGVFIECPPEEGCNSTEKHYRRCKLLDQLKYYENEVKKMKRMVEKTEIEIQELNP